MVNSLRITAARNTLQAYRAERGAALPVDGLTVIEDYITWLIADMLHLAAYDNPHEKTVDRILRLARLHFAAEHFPSEE